MKKFLPLIALSLWCIKTSAQNTVQAEYFIDTDAGVGNNKLLTLTSPQSDGSYSLNIDLVGISVGYHKLYIRTKDSDGKWSITTRRNIELVSPNPIKNMVSGEYFFDIDPGFNAANAVLINPKNEVILQNFTGITSALSIGYHKLYIRLKDNDGSWSLTSRRNIEVYNLSSYFVAGGEYFFNTDPSAGNANVVSFGNPLEDGSFNFKIPLNKIPTGANTLYIRARDSVNGNWSFTQIVRDSIVTSVQDGNWSQPGTWSNNKIPGTGTVVMLYHNVSVDIDAFCKSITPYQNGAKCTVMAGKSLKITGNK